MFSNIYKELFDDTPIPYLHINLTCNDKGEYSSFVIIDYNDAYEKTFISNKQNSTKAIIETPKNPKDKESWQYSFNKAKQNKKYTIEGYISSLETYLNVTIIHAYNNEFFLRFCKLNKQYSALSQVLKNSPFPAWIKDRDGKYIDVNQSKLDCINLTYNDVIGKTNFDLTDNQDAKLIKKYDDKVILNNKMYRYEYRRLNNNNEFDYFEIVKWPYMNADETMILGTIGIAIDISENARLREKLEETEKRFLEIATNIDEIIIIRDEKKAEYINPAFEKVYGFKADALYEDMDNWYDYWDSIEFEESPKCYKYNKKDSYKFCVSKKGREDIWIWSRFVPILDSYGNVVKKIGILSDITESKKSQQELDLIKMEFLANLSHELRTPINLILSSLQVLYLKMDALDSDTYEYFDKYLKILAQNGQRLLKLVNNLIDTTKLDSGCFEYTPKNLNIISYVEDLCMSISSFVNVNDLNIIFDTDEEEKIISFDPDNMERIMLNLLSNAIKFNKPNGSIEVSISCKDNIQISVKDTGIGIPIDKVENVFGRFEQVKSKFKKEREGSGIGLSLVKSLVEMHNGTITLNSTLGEGSEFVITLPDIVINNTNSETIRTHKYNSDINMMKIEFSDIYL